MKAFRASVTVVLNPVGPPRRFHLISRHEDLAVDDPRDALVVRLGTRVEGEDDVDRLLRLFEHHDGRRVRTAIVEDRRVEEVHCFR